MTASHLLPQTAGCASNVSEVRREWRGLKADGHAQEVLDFINSLN
jgi:hypothetical protein